MISSFLRLLLVEFLHSRSIKFNIKYVRILCKESIDYFDTTFYSVLVILWIFITYARWRNCRRNWNIMGYLFSIYREGKDYSFALVLKYIYLLVVLSFLLICLYGRHNTFFWLFFLFIFEHKQNKNKKYCFVLSLSCR